MAIELVTGHAGQEHVSSADAGRFNAGVCGTGKYVLDTGLKFAYSIESANLIRISSGDAVNQGRHITIPPNTYEDAALLNGAQGKTRIDVITLRYSKVTRQVDSETVTLEEASVEVVKGTEVPTGTTPEVPAVISGNIFGGATADDMPLYRVLITDTSVTSVTPVFTVMPSMTTLEESSDGLYQDILALQETARTHGVDLAKVKNLLGDGPLDTASQTVVGAIAELLSSINQPIFKTNNVGQDDITINADWGISEYGRDITIAGYRAVAVRAVGVYGATHGGVNGNWVIPTRCYIYRQNNTDKLDTYFWNQNKNAAAKVKWEVSILYVRTDLVDA